MKTLLFALAVALSAATTMPIQASAQTPGPTCSATAASKNLAGAAKNSFMTRCQKDTAARCDQAAADKKLYGAAKTSFTKKCVSDGVGA